MGDGAFSNVFSASLKLTPAQLAIDPTLGDGKTVDVAVKCVRKYELSYSQVSHDPSLPSLSLYSMDSYTGLVSTFGGWGRRNASASLR